MDAMNPISATASNTWFDASQIIQIVAQKLFRNLLGVG